MSPADPSLVRRHNSGVLLKDLELVVRQVPVADIKRYDRNPRSHSRAQIEKLKDSVSQFGFVSPILLDRDKSIVAGHARLEAAIGLGYTHVPVVELSHLSPMQAKALRLADNKLAELATWNEEVLALEFKDLLEADLSLNLNFDLSITGFSSAEIDRVVDRADRTANDTRDEDVPDVDPDPPVSQLGDIWELGEHRILCGNALDEVSYLALMAGQPAAVGIHDFPYNVPIQGHVSGTGKHNEFVMGAGEMTPAEFTTFLTRGLERVKAASRPGSLQFSCTDWRHVGEMLAAGQGAGLELKNLCVWDKGVGGMGSFYRSQHELFFVFKDPSGVHQNNVQLGIHGRNRTNVWACPGGAAAMRRELELHSTPKPVSLIADIIRDCTSRNDLVLDAFSGSGTTIIAAAKTGRRARVMDLDPHYVDVAVRRWEEWSGTIAHHAATGASFKDVQGERRNAAPELAPVCSPARVRHRVRPSVGGA